VVNIILPDPSGNVG